jgi:hypothetical protein
MLPATPGVRLPTLPATSLWASSRVSYLLAVPPRAPAEVSYRSGTSTQDGPATRIAVPAVFASR